MDMIKKRKAMRGQSGFTLIELLVAVAILAILAGVAVFAVGSLRDNADVSACKTERDTFNTASAASQVAGTGASALPLGNLQATTVTTVPGTPVVIQGKYFQLNNTAGAAVTTKTGVTLPTGC